MEDSTNIPETFRAPFARTGKRNLAQMESEDTRLKRQKLIPLLAGDHMSNSTTQHGKKVPSKIWEPEVTIRETFLFDPSTLPAASSNREVKLYETLLHEEEERKASAKEICELLGALRDSRHEHLVRTTSAFPVVGIADLEKQSGSLAGSDGHNDGLESEPKAVGGGDTALSADEISEAGLATMTPFQASEASEANPKLRVQLGHRKGPRGAIPIKYKECSLLRNVSFSRRKTALMKKAYELSVLTGSKILLIIVSDSQTLYTFRTLEFKPMVDSNLGQRILRGLLNGEDTFGPNTWADGTEE